MYGKMGAAAAPPLSALLPLSTSLGLIGLLLLAAAATAASLPEEAGEVRPVTGKVAAA